jgi:hypothetical protein
MLVACKAFKQCHLVPACRAARESRAVTSLCNASLNGLMNTVKALEVRVSVCGNGSRAVRGVVARSNTGDT